MSSFPKNAFRAYLLRAFIALILCAPAWAQLPSPQLASYIGQTVAAVDVAGRPEVTLKTVQDLIVVKQGQPLSQNDVDSTVTSLKQRGGFQDVKLDLEPEADGVRVEFILQPAVYVGMYEFPGALKEFPYSRLLQVANYNSQMAYSSGDVQQAEDALVKFFRQHGYFLAEVRPKSSPRVTSAWPTSFSIPISAYTQRSARSASQGRIQRRPVICKKDYAR